MIPKSKQLNPGEQKVTDINKVRMRPILQEVVNRHPNAIFAYDEDQILKGNTEYEPGKPYPFVDNA
jgi:hypothetical protein